MAFYVWDTPEVAKHFKSKFYNNQFYIVDNHNSVAKIDMMLPGSATLLNMFKSEGIPEYKLHHKHGFIPANSKLFKEDVDKEREVKQMKEQQETKKVFEVGDKCIIKNVDNKFYTSDDVYENFVDKEVSIVSKFTISPSLGDSDIAMVSVVNEFGYCAYFPELMCYPVKTEKEKEKEKAIEEMMYIVTQGGTVYDIAERLYELGYRKVGE